MASSLLISLLADGADVNWVDGCLGSGLHYAACVGNGGYGVVLHKKNEDPLIISGSVGRMTDNVNCELRGIIEALKLMVVKCSSDNSINKIFVFTDCRSAMDILAKQNNAHKRLTELKEVWSSLERLKALNIDLRLVWIPGHADILGNELADVAAKKGSLIKCDEETFEEISEQVLFGWVKERVLKRWGERWSSADSGAWTRQFLKDVGKKLSFPKDRNSGMVYARALLNNAAVADNMFRMGLSDSTDCNCGEGRETVDHILLECSLESEARGKLRNEIGDIWMNNKKSGGLQFSMSTILNPAALPNINQDDSLLIMSSVFTFFKNLSKKI